MTKNEKEMQEKKIFLMKVALVFGAFFGLTIFGLLLTIAERLREIEEFLRIISN